MPQGEDFRTPPAKTKLFIIWLFRADILHVPMQIYCNGCRRYLKPATQYICSEDCFTHANPANPTKGLEQ